MDKFSELIANGVAAFEYKTITCGITDANLNDLVLQKEEVSEARWFTKSELNALRAESKVIPHIEEFEMIDETTQMVDGTVSLLDVAKKFDKASFTTD